MLPDERTMQILYSQSWNLANEMAQSRAEVEELQAYYYGKLMSPYEPLLKARAETENALNLKSRKVELKETEVDINE